VRGLVAASLLVVLGLLVAPASARPQSQNTLTITASPVTAQVGGNVKVTVDYTAVEDDGSRAVLSVETHPAATPCVDNPYVTTVTGSFIVQLVSVTGTGSKVVTLPAIGAPPGTYRLCAWLTAQSDDSLLTAASTQFTLTPAPTEQSWVGTTSQHQRFGLGTLGQTVIGFNFPQIKLVCSGTHPYTPWVTWPGFADQLSIKIGAGGRFSAVVKQPRANTVSISGTLAGSRVTGTLTDTLHPTLAAGITLNAPPERHVVGGVCRATVHFTAKHVPG
jgi:hypothetical protein